MRVLLVIPLALALSAAALAAPGLSPRPYIPEPVEFEMTAPVPAAAIAANRGFVARAIRAPKRFNLVGLSWRGSRSPEIAVRARSEGGRWTRWTPATGDHSVGTSEPVWVGEADWVQYRMSGRVPGLKLEFVNTTGSATAKDRLLTKLRATAGAATAAVTRFTAPAFGQNAAQPRIRSRHDWGGEKCPSKGVSYGRVKAAVVHHTVTANDYTRAQVPAAILAVCRFHRNTRGWADLGYNFIVDKFGGIWEGRAGGIDEAVMGAHAQGYNAQTTGISNLGTFSDLPQSEAAMGALARLIPWKLEIHGQPAFGKTTLVSAGGASARYPAGATRRFNRVSGHRDTGKTSCPGLQLYRQLPELRERIGEQVPVGEPLTIEGALPEYVVYATDGESFGGRLLSPSGAPVEGLSVELQALTHSGWATLATGVSQYDGTFTAVAKLRRRTVLRWKFAGDETHRPYRGDGVSVGVQPVISLQSSASTIAPGEVVDLTGSIGPAKTSVLTLLVERDDAGIWTRTARVKVKPKGGKFAASRSFDDEGSYRLSVAFAGDTGNLAAVSPYVSVTVVPSVLPF